LAVSDQEVERVIGGWSPGQLDQYTVMVCDPNAHCPGSERYETGS
jgi:hypothetical protein